MHKPATNLDAYDLFLRAQQLEYEFTAESLAAALRHIGHMFIEENGWREFSAAFRLAGLPE